MKGQPYHLDTTQITTPTFNASTLLAVALVVRELNEGTNAHSHAWHLAVPKCSSPHQKQTDVADDSLGIVEYTGLQFETLILASLFP